MDVRQFEKPRGAVSKKPKNTSRIPKPHSKGIKTFSAGFSSENHEIKPKKKVTFDIWTDQKPSETNKEKSSLDRKLEQKRRIAIEAIKLAEQRKLAIMQRSNTKENDVPCDFVEPKTTTRRALFSLDVNQPVIVTQLPAIKETDFMEKPKGRPILKAKQFPEYDCKNFTSLTGIMKELTLQELPKKKKKVVRYSIEELKNMNPLKKDPKF